MRANLFEQRVLVGTAGGAVAKDSDLMPGIRMRLGKVAHVPEYAADRGSEAMKNAQGAFAHGDQNSRSRI